MIDAATEMDTAIGDRVLVEGILMSGRKVFRDPESGKQIDMLLIRIEGRKNPIAVPVNLVYRPSGDRYVLTVTDFNTTLPKLARNIRRLRHERNMTQFEFAQAIGVRQSSVARWEEGKRGISLRHADKIAAVLNVTVAKLLGEFA